MSGFTKLFSAITSSSIWNEEDHTRLVWITMLAMADSRGIVHASVGGLAHTARVSREECQKAINVLLSPDADSRSPEHEGRRIEKIDGGFLLLNYAKYREARSDDERRIYMKEYMKEYRKQRVNNRKQKLTAVSRGKPPLAQAEAEAEKEEIHSSPPTSSEGGKFSLWFKSLLPEDHKLTGDWEHNWAKVYEDMLRLDKRSKDEIKAVCQWARTDSFWRANFLSPLKLRDKNREGVQYFDVFKAKMDSDNAPKNGKHIPNSVQVRL